MRDPKPGDKVFFYESDEGATQVGSHHCNRCSSGGTLMIVRSVSYHEVSSHRVKITPYERADCGWNNTWWAIMPDIVIAKDLGWHNAWR